VGLGVDLVGQLAVGLRDLVVLAALAQEAGHRVTGCDAAVYPPMSDQLAALGIELLPGYGADQLALEPDLFVIGNAVTRGNPLLEAILDANAPYTSGPQWLADVEWAKPALILMGVWMGVGGTNMLLYLAGLSNVPRELLDAASVDGAGGWARFRHVTWPQLAPTTFFIAIMSIIGGLQGGFEQARVMTAGGPAGSTTTLSYYIYNKAFQDLDMGYAAAISWILFAIVFVATAVNWKFGREIEVGA